MSLSSSVHRALRGSALPLDRATRAFMEPRFGRDLRHVRVHTDAVASSSARSINALAYTAGNHIVFDRDRYAPDTVSGRRLLIHELAHVVQHGECSGTSETDWQLGSPSNAVESAADAAVDAIERAPYQRPVHFDALLAATTSSEAVLRRAVTTWGGTWDTTRYNALHTHDGVDIELHFKPGDPVDATMIGIVQKVTSRQGGAAVAVTPTVGARSIPAGHAGAGAHIDRVSTATNPLYPASDVAPAAHLWDSPTVAGWGQHGFHHVDAHGVTHKRDAILIDRPQLPGAGANSSQIFEDTAIAVTGAQTGATYGSVQWGWRTNAAGHFTRLPLTLVSSDVPSSTFRTAQGLWNRNQNSAGAPLLHFYTASRQFVQADNTPLVSDPANAATTEIVQLATNTRVEVINRGVWERFNHATPGVTWWKVTVTDGPSIGRTGWVRSNLLGNARAAGAASGTP
ncbi:MAG TPA: DUF4157 domain-containing protein [Terracidiphilus sp.]|nr:DUF4157 domain-containing protein [Terracidiphilus sp.]